MVNKKTNGFDILTGIKKKMYIFFGTFFLIMGSIGIFVPILPTTPFLILAAICYSYGSKKMYDWLTNNRLFGNLLKNYLEGKGMSIRAKLFSISSLWFFISFSVFFLIDIFWIEIVLLLVAFGVTAHILLIKPRAIQ